MTAMVKKHTSKASAKISPRSIQVPVVIDTSRTLNAGQYIKSSNTVLTIIGRKMSVTGVSLPVDPEVPTYFADSRNPQLVIRTLRGQRVRGQFVQGRFKKA